MKTNFKNKVSMICKIFRITYRHSYATYMQFMTGKRLSYWIFESIRINSILDSLD